MKRILSLLWGLVAAGAAVAGISPPYGWTSEPMALDIESGTRAAAGTESLCLDAAWVAEATNGVTFKMSVNADTIRRYRLRFARYKPTSTWNELPDAAFLRCIGALAKDEKDVLRPTLAGLVCFGDFVTIARHVPNYFVDYREKLTGETRWNDRVCAHDGTWSGNIYDFFFQIHDKIVSDVRKPFTIAKDGITRIDENEVHESIREVLANALIHTDYHGRRGIVIEKQFRQITFENPGCFRMSQEDAVSGGRSDARNHLIFNIFALVEIGERSGHGLSNLFGVWDKYAFPRPTIRESYDPDRTTGACFLFVVQMGLPVPL